MFTLCCYHPQFPMARGWAKMERLSQLCWATLKTDKRTKSPRNSRHQRSYSLLPTPPSLDFLNLRCDPCKGADHPQKREICPSPRPAGLRPRVVPHAFRDTRTITMSVPGLERGRGTDQSTVSHPWRHSHDRILGLLPSWEHRRIVRDRKGAPVSRGPIFGVGWCLLS